MWPAVPTASGSGAHRCYSIDCSRLIAWVHPFIACTRGCGRCWWRKPGRAARQDAPRCGWRWQSCARWTAAAGGVEQRAAMCSTTAQRRRARLPRRCGPPTGAQRRACCALCRTPIQANLDGAPPTCASMAPVPASKMSTNLRGGVAAWRLGGERARHGVACLLRCRGRPGACRSCAQCRPTPALQAAHGRHAGASLPSKLAL